MMSELYFDYVINVSQTLYLYLRALQEIILNIASVMDFKCFPEIMTLNG